MKKNLPARPNLDHLRRQSKELLAALERRDAEAVTTVQQFLPAAKGLSSAQVLEKHYRLADAQSAVARKTGFAGWPHLARHVEQLRALEGSWAFERLEIDGGTIPASALKASRLLIDGDRFRTESPEANYEGIFNINVEADPHEIDIEFVEGPEAGNRNYGIFRLNGDQLELCLDMNGRPRPDQFQTFPGSGRACETLVRASRSRPDKVTGGTPPEPASIASSVPSAPALNKAAFTYVESATLTRLLGQWTATKIIRDGQPLPAMMVKTGVRIATKNEIQIRFAGQLMIHALVKLDESTDPMHVDYLNIGGACNGSVQHGIMKWIGQEVCFCMGAVGQPRPSDFTSTPGSGNTVSQWRLKS